MTSLKISSPAIIRIFLFVGIVLSSGFFMSGAKVEAATANWDYSQSGPAGTSCTGGDSQQCSDYPAWSKTFASFSATDGGASVNTYAPGATVTVAVLAGVGAGNTFNGWSGALNNVMNHDPLLTLIFGTHDYGVGADAYFNGVNVAHCAATNKCAGSGTFTAPTTPGTYSINLSGWWYKGDQNIGNSSMTFKVANTSCTVDGIVHWNASGANTTGPCSQNVSVTVPSGGSQTVTNTAAGYTGSATFGCSSTGWTGPTSVSCSAPGTCGTANGKTYPSGATGYSPDTQCSVGVSTNTLFPPAGGTYAWLCNNNGSYSSMCQAWRATATSPTGTISAANCTIPQDSNVCTTYVSSSASNISSGKTSVKRSVSPSASWANVGLTMTNNPYAYVDKAGLTFSLYAEWEFAGPFLDSVTVAGTCTSGTSFDASGYCRVASVPPPNPATVTATAGACGTGEIELNWSAVAGATGYDTQIDGAWSTDRGNVTTYTYTGLGNSISHTFAVRAWNGAGAGTGKASTPSPITTAGACLATAGVCGPAAKSYVAGATAYSGAYCTSVYGNSAIPAFPAAGGSSNWYCKNSVGTNDAYCTADRATQNPTSVIASTGACGGKIDMSWDATINASSYSVYQTSGTFVANTGGTSITLDDTNGIGLSTTYNFYVRANNSAGTQSSNSANTGSVTSSDACVGDPSTPTGLTVTPLACDTAKNFLNWDDATNATSYSIYTSTGTYIDSSLGSNYTHTGALNTSYSYKVRANNSAGTQSGDSAVESGTTKDACPPGGGNTLPTAIIDLPTGPKTIVEGASVSFKGRGTDPDAGSSITAYEWRTGSCAGTPIAASANATVSSFIKALSPYTVYFRVKDNTNAWSTNCPSRTITVTTGGGLTECDDGTDNDGDGLIDDLDPGCTDPSDNNEKDVVPPTITATYKTVTSGTNERLLVPYNKSVRLDLYTGEASSCTLTKASMSHPSTITSSETITAVHSTKDKTVMGSSIYMLTCGNFSDKVTVEILSGGFET